MRVSLLTREYPPEVYGGAGVHVEYLSRDLARHVDLTVHCWGADRADPAVHAYRPWDALAGEAPHLAALQAMSIDLAMTAGVEGADLVHSHTWYAQLGGHLAKQLGGGYALSCFCERVGLEGADTVIAVSEGSKRDILACYPAIDEGRVHVVYNGIDTAQYAPDRGTDVLERFGVDAGRPSVVFVGRITRQKGVPLLLRAATDFAPETQLVLCAGAPDTPEIGAEVAAGVERLKATRDGVIWIDEMLPKTDVIQLLSHATVFACPSIYEPLGIVNLEAMACEAAVVASEVGGIPEVVHDGETGFLVALEQAPGSIDPVDPAGYAAAFAQRVNQLIADPELARTMGQAGRRRAIEHFGWPAIAEQTLSVYRRAGATD
jgi:alpha-maltose-1-phosphate synthase